MKLLAALAALPVALAFGAVGGDDGDDGGVFDEDACGMAYNEGVACDLASYAAAFPEASVAAVFLTDNDEWFCDNEGSNDLGACLALLESGTWVYASDSMVCVPNSGEAGSCDGGNLSLDGGHGCNDGILLPDGTSLDQATYDCWYY